MPSPLTVFPTTHSCNLNHGLRGRSAFVKTYPRKPNVSMEASYPHCHSWYQINSKKAVSKTYPKVLSSLETTYRKDVMI